jgi:hypothetical protein
MISGNIILTDSTDITISDENVVANSISIEMSTCRPNRFDFGTFNAAVLKIGVIITDAANMDFSGAVVNISDITYDGEDEVETLLGQYIVDGSQTRRERETVYLTAYDHAQDFDRSIPDNVRNTSYTALTAIQAACTACDITLDSTLPTGAPNTSITFTLKSAAVQTWRDIVMWACQLIGCNAVLSREGILTIRQAWYEYNATPDIICTAADRVDIKFSDTRVYVKYLTAYSGAKPKTYTSAATQPSQSKPGMMTIEKNPLLSDKTEAECDIINQALADKSFTQRRIEAKLFSNTEIALGKIGMYSGGKVDVRNSIRGMTTGVTWKYHGYTRVICTAPETVQGE